ncbi:MAG: radical SAM protein [Ignavibacteriota bacterium]
MITRQEALDLFASDDLIGIGMEADAVRRRWHPENVVSYIIDRNINYTNFCTEYCTFCAFYRPMGHAEGYVLPKETIFEKIQETLDLGGTGVLMQGGLHPDLKIEWYEDLFRSIKQRYPIHLHCLSAPEVTNIADVSGLSLRDTIKRLMDSGLDSIPGGGAEILDDGVRHRISRLKCSTQDWVDVHRTAHQTRHAHHRDHDVWVRRDHRTAHESLGVGPQSTGRDGRVYRLHSVDVPAGEHGRWGAS